MKKSKQFIYLMILICCNLLSSKVFSKDAKNNCSAQDTQIEGLKMKLGELEQKLLLLENSLPLFVCEALCTFEIKQSYGDAVPFEDAKSEMINSKAPTKDEAFNNLVTHCSELKGKLLYDALFTVPGPRGMETGYRLSKVASIANSCNNKSN
jgi:hypothetical protein